MSYIALKMMKMKLLLLLLLAMLIGLLKAANSPSQGCCNLTKSIKLVRINSRYDSKKSLQCGENLLFSVPLFNVRVRGAAIRSKCQMSSSIGGVFLQPHQAPKIFTFGTTVEL
jgi:hypothetical protein